MEGIVYKSTGSWYILKDELGKMHNARVKGKFRNDDTISSSNPIAVGDKVIFDIENVAEKSCIIHTIKERNNYIVRVSPHNKNQKHIVAANMHHALIVATITNPRTSQGFIDRFLITAEAYHIKPIIVFNKIDLLKAKHQDNLQQWTAMYRKAGYDVFAITALNPETIKPLEEILKNKTTLFSGHSGVGKSTLINQLIPTLQLKTQEISDWSGKGQHTTTFAEMFDLPFGGAIIDTPGVKEFGLVDMQKNELAHYYPELRALLNECQFNNCLHLNEPNCAVKQNAQEGKLALDRYSSYLTILADL